ncbi:MAG: hypothetical protein ABSA81_10155 [Candidatus Bathyarchaeia archaeon]|jgi:hypothetical protein
MHGPATPLLDLNHCRKPQEGSDENYGITDWAGKAKATPFSVSPSSETMMLHET